MARAQVQWINNDLSKDKDKRDNDAAAAAQIAAGMEAACKEFGDINTSRVDRNPVLDLLHDDKRSDLSRDNYSRSIVTPTFVK